MKTKQVKSYLSILSMSLILPLSSCSSDDNPSPNPTEAGKSSYSLTIEGDKNYSNAWDMDAEDGAIVSPHNNNPEGDQNIGLIIADDAKDFSLNGALMLNTQIMQPLALGNVQTSEDDHSTIVITVGETNYMSNSGSAVFSNLVIKPFTQYTGFASFTMTLDGRFDIMETEAIEQIRIHGTVISADLF